MMVKMCAAVTALGVALVFGVASASLAGPKGDPPVKTKPDEPPSISPTAALSRLVAGNRRFAEGKPDHTNQDAKRRAEVAQGQRPFAMILSCSDSRVPPEVVFDQGLGDLFIVRNAGNGADLSALASMQYAAGHLGPRLMVILGHEKCGAVSAALAGAEAAKEEPEELQEVLNVIRPGLSGVPIDLKDDKRGNAAVEANVRDSMRRLMNSPGFKRLTEAKGVQVIGAIYDLETGKVRFLSDK